MWSARYGPVDVPSASDIKWLCVRFKTALAVGLESDDVLQLGLEFRTAPLLLNLIAFEQSVQYAQLGMGDVSSYAWFMHGQAGAVGGGRGHACGCQGGAEERAGQRKQRGCGAILHSASRAQRGSRQTRRGELPQRTCAQRSVVQLTLPASRCRSEHRRPGQHHHCEEAWATVAAADGEASMRVEAVRGRHPRRDPLQAAPASLPQPAALVKWKKAAAAGTPVEAPPATHLAGAARAEGRGRGEAGGGRGRGERR
ncbi:hypothetical protein EJB05_34102, partial [Eragrostis curvula]